MTQIDLLNEPLYQNNSVLSLWSEDFSEEDIQNLKTITKDFSSK